MSINKGILFLVVSMLVSLSFSSVEMGLRMGAMYPDNDALVQQTFGTDFSWQGVVGYLDDSGWEIRGTLSQYGNLSHHPYDIATANGLRVDITSLYASMIYHLSPKTAKFQPYLGGGVGAYFVNYNDVYGQLSAETKFGFNMLAGVKFALNDDVSVVSEYSRHLVPASFTWMFSSAKNFDLSSFTLGIDLKLPEYSKAPAPTYKYSRYEEELLLEIQQTRKELDDMRKKRQEAQQQIDDFYLTADPQDRSFDKKYAAIKFLESKMSVMDRQIQKAQDSVLELSKTWEKDHTTAQPVETQVIYLEKNYRYSPYGLQMNQGFIVRPGFAHQAHFSYDWSTPAVIHVTTPAPTVEDKKAFVEKKKQRLDELKDRPLLPR